MFINVEPKIKKDLKFEDDATILFYNEILSPQNHKNDKGLFLADDNEDTFHRAIRPVIKIGQCFGLFPVSGISGPDHTHLRMDVKSSLFAWFCITGIGSGTLFGFSFIHMLFEGVDLDTANSAIFFFSAFSVSLLFFRLSWEWPKICTEIAKREFKIKRNLNIRKYSLRMKLKFCCYFILLLSLFEHLLAITNGVCNALDCLDNRTTLFKSFFVKSYPMVFYYTEYSEWKSILLQLNLLESTFNWNFLDLFIIEMSVALTDRFHKLNDHLKLSDAKHVPSLFWKLAREDYCHLAYLVRTVDKSINKIILLSFANDLYFICVQLFHTFTPKEITECDVRPFSQVIHVVYFAYSFAYLMGRSLAVWLITAHLHTVSKRPAEILYAVPSSSFSEDTQRMLEQVTNDVVAFSGMNFFNITRGIILTIAGTVVTYELVLVQFNALPDRSGNMTNSVTELCDISPKT